MTFANITAKVFSPNANVRIAYITINGEDYGSFNLITNTFQPTGNRSRSYCSAAVLESTLAGYGISAQRLINGLAGKENGHKVRFLSQQEKDAQAAPTATTSRSNDLTAQYLRNGGHTDEALAMGAEGFV